MGFEKEKVAALRQEPRWWGIRTSQPARRRVYAKSKFFSFPGKPCIRRIVEWGPRPDAIYNTALSLAPRLRMSGASIVGGNSLSGGGSVVRAEGSCCAEAATAARRTMADKNRRGV